MVFSVQDDWDLENDVFIAQFQYFSHRTISDNKIEITKKSSMQHSKSFSIHYVA